MCDLVPRHRHEQVAAHRLAGTAEGILGAIVQVVRLKVSQTEHVVSARREYEGIPVEQVAVKRDVSAFEGVADRHRRKRRPEQHAVPPETDRQQVVEVMDRLHGALRVPAGIGEVHAVRLEQARALRRVHERAARVAVGEEQPATEPVPQQRALVAPVRGGLAATGRVLCEGRRRAARGVGQRRGKLDPVQVRTQVRVPRGD